MSMKEFQILGRLGEGAYSSVFRVKRLSDKTQYALKKVKMGKLSAKEKENAVNEVRILASIDHANVIGYRQVFFEDASSSLCLVMDYADGGDVYQKICQHQKSGTYFPESEIWSIFIQIVKGLHALHKRKILHRDMKSANIFLCKNGIAKLGDLNVSKVAKKGLLYTQTGTPYYASPEVWKDLPYDERSDIWSLGCVLYEIVTLKPPFRANDMQGLYKKVVRGQYSRIPSQYTNDLSQLIAHLLQTNARMRPSCRAILEMQIVQKHMHMLPSSKTNPLSVSVNMMEATINPELDLLGTIKVPRNLLNLGERLPKPNYLRNQSVPSKLPQVGAGEPDRLEILRSQKPTIDASVRQALHDKVAAVLDDVTEKNLQERAKKAIALKNEKINKQNQLIAALEDTAKQRERIIHKSKRPSGVYQKAKAEMSSLEAERQRQKSRESEPSLPRENQENREHRYQDPRIPQSRKLLLPPRLPDGSAKYAPSPKENGNINVDELYSHHHRAQKRQLNQIYSRVYGMPTPLSNPSRHSGIGRSKNDSQQDLKLPNIRSSGAPRYQGGGSNSVNPLIRGGASISASKRALLQEVDPTRKNAISVLPPSRGSYQNGQYNYSPHRGHQPRIPDTRMQHVSLDQGHVASYKAYRRGEVSNHYFQRDQCTQFESMKNLQPIVNPDLRQYYSHDRLASGESQFVTGRNMPSGAQYSSQVGKLATPVWWG